MSKLETNGLQQQKPGNWAAEIWEKKYPVIFFCLVIGEPVLTPWSPSFLFLYKLGEYNGSHSEQNLFVFGLPTIVTTIITEMLIAENCSQIAITTLETQKTQLTLKQQRVFLLFITEMSVNAQGKGGRKW